MTEWKQRIVHLVHLSWEIKATAFVDTKFCFSLSVLDIDTFLCADLKLDFSHFYSIKYRLNSFITTLCVKRCKHDVYMYTSYLFPPCSDKFCCFSFNAVLKGQRGERRLLCTIPPINLVTWLTWWQHTRCRRVAYATVKHSTTNLFTITKGGGGSTVLRFALVWRRISWTKIVISRGWLIITCCYIDKKKECKKYHNWLIKWA